MFARVSLGYFWDVIVTAMSDMVTYKKSGDHSLGQQHCTEGVRRDPSRCEATERAKASSPLDPLQMQKILPADIAPQALTKFGQFPLKGPVVRWVCGDD